MLVAKRERNKGDSPYMTMDVLEARPIRPGKFFVAANTAEKKLEMTWVTWTIGASMCTYEEAWARPARPKHVTRILKESEDGWVMSSGVEAYVQADKPNAEANKTDEINEHTQGP